MIEIQRELDSSETAELVLVLTPPGLASQLPESLRTVLGEGRYLVDRRNRAASLGVNAYPTKVFLLDSVIKAVHIGAGPAAHELILSKADSLASVGGASDSPEDPRARSGEESSGQLSTK